MLVERIRVFKESWFFVDNKEEYKDLFERQDWS